MTFREKLMQEYPEFVDSCFVGGCRECPCSYGYEEGTPCRIYDDEQCHDCWNRKMPMNLDEQEAHDLAINAEIIRAYCGDLICGKCPAMDTCRDEPGLWSDGYGSYTSAKKQRAILDAFEGALPPLDEDDAERTDTEQNDHCAEHDPINHPSQPMQHDAVNNPSQPTQHDAVNHPSHYTSGKVECIDAIESAIHAMQGERAFLTGQVIKYLWRWPLKNGVEDLRKARWYLDRLIKFVEGVNAERGN